MPGLGPLALGDGLGAAGLDQPHADLGDAREHPDLPQREAAAAGLDVEVGVRASFHGTHHEQSRCGRAVNIA